VSAIWLKTTCNLKFKTSEETTFIFMLRPKSGHYQWISREKYTIRPNIPIVEFTDTYGNLCQRLVAPKGTLQVNTSHTVKVPQTVKVNRGASLTKICDIPENVLTYLLPSRYCECDKLGPLSWEIASNAKPGYDQVLKIQDWIKKKIAYVPGSSNFPLSAVEMCQENIGVCRDLAHLGIALCRGLSIPARIVVGYLHELSPMDLHAWFEAYIDGQWYTFDATQSKAKAGRVAIAYGRDAADVAIFNQFGPLLEYSEMNVGVKLLRRPPR
jgi:transglutaminase-like putative cysteine protease